jgi:hypothetical protein
MYPPEWLKSKTDQLLTRMSINCITEGNINWYNSSGKSFVYITPKAKCLTHDPTITLLDMYPKGINIDMDF